MAININKRTRALVTDEWSDWLITTDIPPYTNTELVEYRVDNNSVYIDIADITDNVTVDSEYIVSGDGYFDDLMETIEIHLDAQEKKGLITGDNYAKAYSANMTNAMNQAINFALSKRTAEIKADMSQEQLEVAQESHDSKVSIGEYQAEKVNSDRLYVDEQTKQLPRSIRFNNRIKAVASMSDMMGTFGAGGLTFDDTQWEFYYNQIASVITDLNDYRGEWDASTNTPDISAVTDMEEGDFYRVSVAGGTNLDGTDTWALNDIAVYLGDRWVKSDVVIPSSFNVEVVS